MRLRFLPAIIGVFLVFSSCQYLSAHSVASFTETDTEISTLELHDVEHEIDSLENFKHYYSSKSDRLKTRAFRYQAQNNSIEARNMWNEAASCDKIVRRVDDELPRLYEARDDLTKKLRRSQEARVSSSK